MAVRSLVLSLALLATGCTYITRGVFEDRRAQIDEDGDGVRNEEDCDDRDAGKAPTLPELAYDGIDNDCDGLDLVDQDGDGFPGLLEPDYPLGVIPYPEELKDKELDCADDPALIPEAAAIQPDPTGAIEVAYDGLDSDCQRDNDFDSDGDGYMPDVVDMGGVDVATDVALATYLDLWGVAAEAGAWGPGGAGPALRHDCDDTDPDVHPDNAIAEAWYDGIDRNCDDHNDFDQDGDGFMPPEADGGAYEVYVGRYYGAQIPPFDLDPELPYGDCLDEADPGKLVFPSGDPVDPVEVHPATAAHPVTDAPYDAVDADCAADNDFDLDGDGFVPDTIDDPGPGADFPTLPLMDAYADAWGYDAATVEGWVDGNPDAGLTTPTDGDCDDDAFDTWPGAVERVGDGEDQDCDGAADTSAFGFGSATFNFDWTNPTNPEVARLADRMVVLVGATTANLPNALTEVGVALPFLLESARGGAAPTGTFSYWKSSNPSTVIQPRFDVAYNPLPVDLDLDGIPDPTLYTLYNTISTFTGYTTLNVTGVRLQTGTGSMIVVGGTQDFVTLPYTASAVDMIMDGDGNPFALACLPGRLHTLYSTALTPPHLSITTAGGDTCFFEGSPVPVGPNWEADFSLCEAGACAAWTEVSTPQFVGGTPTADTWAYGDQDEGWISLVDDSGAATVRDASGAIPDQVAFPTSVVDRLDADEHDGTIYIAGILNGEVWLQFGPPGSFDFLQLPFDDPSVSGEAPREIAVYADADRVAVAVTATTGLASQDSVGWVFLGPP